MINRPFLRVQARILHMNYEENTSVEKRIEVATKIYDIARNEFNSKIELKQLHYALDVILHQVVFNNIDNEGLRERYWMIGNQIANAIKNRQQFLNIPAFWFAKNYNEANKMVSAYHR